MPNIRPRGFGGVITLVPVVVGRWMIVVPPNIIRPTSPPDVTAPVAATAANVRGAKF